MKIITTGRTDIESYFKISGIREQKRLNHHPFLIFVSAGEDKMQVLIIDSAKTLLEYGDNVQVMAQWGGKWNSNFFQFTVGQFRKHIQENPKQDYYEV